MLSALGTTEFCTRTRPGSGSWRGFKQRPVAWRPPMDEPTAWLSQARADWRAAERFLAAEENAVYCHAIAKWQQTLEKAIKAIVSALHDAGILGTGIRAKHDVERYVRVLVRLPRSAGH